MPSAAAIALGAIVGYRTQAARRTSSTRLDASSTHIEMQERLIGDR